MVPILFHTIAQSLAPRSDQRVRIWQQHACPADLELFVFRRACWQSPALATLVEFPLCLRVQDVSVITEQDNQTSSHLRFVEQGREHRDFLSRSPRVDLIAFKQVIIDGIDNNTHNATVRGTNRLPYVACQHGVVVFS